MQCLKCGRETPAERKEVFCADCLKVMEAFPVKPGTPVQIPQRQAAPKRTPAHSAPKPEAIIQRLRRKVTVLRIIAAALLLIFIITASVLSVFLYRATKAPVIGSNYSTVSTDEP